MIGLQRSGEYRVTGRIEWQAVQRPVKVRRPSSNVNGEVSLRAAIRGEMGGAAFSVDTHPPNKAPNKTVVMYLSGGYEVLMRTFV
jgi:hypothetical protein